MGAPPGATSGTPRRCLAYTQLGCPFMLTGGVLGALPLRPSHSALLLQMQWDTKTCPRPRSVLGRLPQIKLGPFPVIFSKLLWAQNHHCSTRH